MEKLTNLEGRLRGFRATLAREGPTAERAAAVQPVLAAIDEALARLQAGPGAAPPPPADAREGARALEQLLAEAEAARQRLAFLWHFTTTVIELPLDLPATLGRLAALTIPELADGCSVFLQDHDGGLQAVAAACRDPRSGEMFFGDPAGSPALDLAGLDEVLRNGRTLLLNDLGEGCGSDRRAVAAMVVPLSARGRCFGVLVLLLLDAPVQRRFRPDDRALAEELAHRAALAIDNGRLYGEARRAIAARDDMLSFVSHDLRNPLGAILLNATLLQQWTPESAGGVGQARALAESILHSTERMKRLIADLQDSASLQAGRFSIDCRSHAVEGLLSEALQMMRPHATHKGVRLEPELLRRSSRARCDRERILQVFSNLIGNAIKFTPARGLILVRGEPSGGNIVFSVADNGAGIPPENLSCIFDRYWQGREAGRQGMGLGLYIAKGIIEAHGGRIWAESRPGAGSTFFFTLPSEEPKEADSSSSAVLPRNGWRRWSASAG
jgi:signal transduction histidine kinase